MSSNKINLAVLTDAAGSALTQAEAAQKEAAEQGARALQLQAIIRQGKSILQANEEAEEQHATALKALDELISDEAMHEAFRQFINELGHNDEHSYNRLGRLAAISAAREHRKAIVDAAKRLILEPSKKALAEFLDKYPDSNFGR